jgi:hypothetical protein
MGICSFKKEEYFFTFTAMIKSKAIDIIKAFSAGEFKEFGKIVSSPYFNSNQNLQEVYVILKKNYPKFSQKNFTKENIYNELFPGKKYNDGTMRKLLSQLQNLAEEFLSHSALDGNYNFYKKLFLLNRLYEKRLDNSFLLHLKEINQIYKQKNNYDESYFNYNYEIEVANLNFYLSKGRAGFEPEKTMDDLLKCSVYLICYSLIVTLKLNQDIIATGISFDFDYQKTIAFKFIELLGGINFLELVKESAPDFYPIIAVYYYAFLIASQRDNDDKYYFEMKNLITNNINSFSRIEQYNLALILENCSDDKIRKGKDFREELHSVHNFMLLNNLYSWKSTDYFPLVGFRKMVKNALMLNKFEWTASFIEKYLIKMPPEFRDTMNYFSQALMSFHKGKFDQALKNI